MTHDTRTRQTRPGRLRRSALYLLVVSCGVMCFTDLTFAGGFDEREIQNRAAPVAKRKCTGPPNGGKLCNEDADCAPYTCADRNVFNITVAILFEATVPGELNRIKAMISGGNQALFDATDGQAEIGQAFIFNNAYNEPADIRIYRKGCSSGDNRLNPCDTNTECPASCSARVCDAGANEGNPCENNADCGGADCIFVCNGGLDYKDPCETDAECRDASCGFVGWQADTGHYPWGSFHVSMNHIHGSGDWDHFVHEFSHLVFDTKDEYESIAEDCRGDNIDNDYSCPVAQTLTNFPGETNCIMSTGGTDRDEYCWGHDNGSNLANGNHDADGTTEQSRCRDGRSCWEQVVWSWPDVMLMPVGAPDPLAHGAETDDPKFIDVDDTMRVVLVLDESGSMDNVDGSTTTRLHRLKLAAKDIVTMAEDGTEIGIVSFSTDAGESHPSKPIAPLGADRSDWMEAIDKLHHEGYTNIGDGLAKAMEMIEEAPDDDKVSPFIVLMTDGINNEPGPDPQGDLEEKLGMLATAGIPVYVTCTGTDLGLESQCAEIAAGAGKGGWYEDSDESSDLAEAFVDFHERAARRDAVDSATGMLSTAAEKVVFVEEGAESVTFTLVWENADADANMFIIDPHNNQHRSLPMPQGLYGRFSAPTSGDWKVFITRNGGADSSYVMRAYVRSQEVQMTAAVRHASVLPGEPIYLYGFLRTLGGGVTHPTEKIVGTVLRPDGTTDTVELHDQGRDLSGEGDDMAGDGIFTGVYTNTGLPGAYTFLLRSEVDGWPQSTDSEEVATDFRSRRFRREVRLSAAVVPDCNRNGINDVTEVREDPSRDCNGNGLPDECDLAGTSRDCNDNGILDECDLASGMFDDLNANGIPDECESGHAVLVFSGTAEGGQVSITVQGFFNTCVVTIDTFAGQSAATVAANLAAAINADGCLVAQDITAQAADGSVSVTGFLISAGTVTVDITDPGLSYRIPVLSIPALSLWGLLALAVVLFAAAVIRLAQARRRRFRNIT